MKKIFELLVVFLLTTTISYSADMRFIQIDGLFYNPNKIETFNKLIEKINKEKNVDFVIFTGNNISGPNKTFLKDFLSEAKKLKPSYYIVLGQKDVNIQKDLSKKEYMKLVCKKNKAHKKIKSPNYVFKKKDLIFIVVDGSKEVIPNSIGYYKEDTILWLDSKLDLYKDKKVIIIQHYPLVPPAKKEARYTYKADEYLKLLSEHNNVKAIISGHFDTNKEIMYENILHISTKNAPTYRIIDILNYETSEPTFWSTIKD